MKKNALILLGLLTLSVSCGSDDSNGNIIDCINEEPAFSVTHTASASNSKTINFEVAYTGNYTLNDQIIWDYGDGSPLVSIQGVTTSHTYDTAGTYTATAVVSLNNPGCNLSLSETVVVQ